jgi:hypothetical protein
MKVLRTLAVMVALAFLGAVMLAAAPNGTPAAKRAAAGVDAGVARRNPEAEPSFFPATKAAVMPATPWEAPQPQAASPR